MELIFSSFVDFLLLGSQIVLAIWLLLLQRKVSLRPKNDKIYAENQVLDFKTRVQALEMAWDDTYTKLRKIMGRADRVHALNNPEPASPALTEVEQKAAIWKRMRAQRNAQ